MSSSRNTFGVIAGTLAGVAAGVVAGIMIAPRPGFQTRAQVAQDAGRAWNTVVDVVEHEAREAAARTAVAAGDASAMTDELRQKVEAARARMDQIRSNIAAKTAAPHEIVVEAVAAEERDSQA